MNLLRVSHSSTNRYAAEADFTVYSGSILLRALDKVHWRKVSPIIG